MIFSWFCVHSLFSFSLEYLWAICLSQAVFRSVFLAFAEFFFCQIRLRTLFLASFFFFFFRFFFGIWCIFDSILTFWVLGFFYFLRFLLVLGLLFVGVFPLFFWWRRFGPDWGRNSAIWWRCLENYSTGSLLIGFSRLRREFTVWSPFKFFVVLCKSDCEWWNVVFVISCLHRVLKFV